MSIRANFYVTIDPLLYEPVSARLGQLGLKIDSRGVEDALTKTVDRSHIMIFQQEYRNADSVAILERMTQVYGINGVRCIQPLYTREDEPEIKPKKRGYLIALVVGTVINLVNIVIRDKSNKTQCQHDRIHTKWCYPFRSRSRQHALHKIFAVIACYALAMRSLPTKSQHPFKTPDDSTEPKILKLQQLHITIY